MIYIYPSLGDSFSMKRYLSGLEEGLNELKLPYRLVRPSYEGNSLKRLFSKYFIYSLKALKTRSKDNQHIIVSERYSYLLPFLGRKNVIIVCHDLHTLYAEAPVSFVNRWFYLRLIKLMARANKIVCVSEHTKTDLLEKVGRKTSNKVKVVHNGLEKFWSSVEKKDEPFLDALFEEKQVVLSVGTDAWYKNFRLAIEVIEALPEEYQLLRIGEIGGENEYMIQSLSLSSRIMRFEFLDDEELKSAYARSVCLIFPSTSEGFGWPALEAIASGGEVVTTGFGSISEVCKDKVHYAVNKSQMVKVISKLRTTETDSSDNYEKRDFAKSYTWAKAVGEILS